MREYGGSSAYHRNFSFCQPYVAFLPQCPPVRYRGLSISLLTPDVYCLFTTKSPQTVVWGLHYFATGAKLIPKAT